MYTIEERSKLLVEFFERRKKLHAKERAVAEQERDADFVPIGSEKDEKMIDKMNKKATGMDEEEVPEELESTKVEVKQEGREENIRKRSASLKIVPDEEEEIDYEVLGMSYLIVNWESAFYHTDRYGVPHDYYRVFKANGSSRYIKTFTEMVSRFDRLDLMQRFSTTTPEGIDLVLWGDLRIIVHILALEDGTEIHMLAERRYPLLRETLKRMMKLKLNVESEGEVVFDLLRFIQKQIDDKELASPKQTALGKDISNPLIVGSLLKKYMVISAPCYSNEALAILEQTATGKEISNLFMAGEDCWVLEDFTTYCCWFNIGAASEDLVLLRKIEENRLSL
ncbi:hypothetical protein Tco_0905921 [Tanacetum coccineum]